MATVLKVFPLMTAHEWSILSVDEMIKKLRDCVELRNDMRGATYWNLLNDDAVRIANRCVSLGANREDVESILGDGNYY